MPCCLCRWCLAAVEHKAAVTAAAAAVLLQLSSSAAVSSSSSGPVAGMSELQNTHKAVLKVLAEVCQNVIDQIELYNGDCVLNLSAVYDAYKDALPAGTAAAEQRIVSMALRTKLKEGGVQLLQAVRRAIGPPGASSLTPHLHLAETDLQKVKQQVRDILGAVKSNNTDELNIQLMEALVVESQLQQEVSELKSIRDQYRDRLSRIEDEVDALHSQLEDWKQRHKADLALQRLHQPELDDFMGPYAYLEYLRDEHTKKVYSDSTYAQEWGYSLLEDGERLRTADGGWRIKVYDYQSNYQSTKVGWNGDAIGQRSELLQGEGKLDGYTPISGYRALVLLHGDSKRLEPMPQYCKMCGLCFNMRGVGLAEHVIVCSREYGVAP